MVYLHFPTSLTDEEKMLHAKYEKLKKKKKALQKQKAPHDDADRLPVKVAKGPKVEARDAREVAKMLLKSGAISPIVKPNKRAENVGFKRPSRFRAQERRLTEEPAVGYQPFAAIPTEDVDEPKHYNPPSSKSKDFIKFVHERNPKSKTFDKSSKVKIEEPVEGTTIAVQINPINENILNNTFSTFGDIVHIEIKLKKEIGYITFKSEESAERAIKELNGKSIDGKIIKVYMAETKHKNRNNNGKVTSLRGDDTSNSRNYNNDRREEVTIYEDVNYDLVY